MLRKNLPSTVKYLEVASSARVVFTGSFTLDGLFVKEEGKGASIPTGASVTVAKEIYMKQTTSLGGTLSGNFAAYHGGVAADKDYVVNTGGGKLN